jgi:hypothetical protein
MLRLLVALLVLVAQPAFAANPTITVPVGQIVLPNTATTLSGISIAEVGASALTTFTTTISSADGAVITATGSGVFGSGTSTLTITGTATQTTTMAATIQITYATSALLQADTLTITAKDSSNNATSPATIAVQIDGTKYLAFSTLAAAQARSQAMCAALGCKGVTKCWWSVVPASGTTVTGDNCTGTAASGGASIRILPGDPCYDYKPGSTGPCAALGIAFPSATLTTSEQSSLVAATGASLPTPAVIGH